MELEKLTKEREALREKAAKDPRQVKVRELSDKIAFMATRGASESERAPVIASRDALRDEILAPVISIQEKISEARKVQKSEAKKAMASELEKSSVEELEKARHAATAKIKELGETKKAIVEALSARQREVLVNDLLNKMTPEERELLAKRLSKK